VIVEPDVIGFGAEEPRPQHQAWWSGLLETDTTGHAGPAGDDIDH
jgi:hypothetical protein